MKINYKDLLGFVSKKRFKVGLLILAAGFVSVAYQNCSQQSGGVQVSGQSQFSSLSAEDDLFSQLQQARELSSLLKTYDLSSDSASVVLQTAPMVAKQLLAKAELIEKAITVDMIPTNSNVVLKEVDSLVDLLAQAREVRVAYDSIRRDKILALRIDAVEANLRRVSDSLTDLGGAFNAFKIAISARVDALVVQMEKWEDRANAIQKAIDDLATKTSADDLALKAALEQLKNYTETELVAVKTKSQTLEADLIKQKEEQERTKADIAAAQEEMKKLGAISNRLCKYDAEGQVSDARTKCSTATQGGSCCLTVDVVDCSALFPNAPAALNQCGILITVIKNHDQQLQAIRAVDEKQNSALNRITNSIDSIIGNISTLNSSVKSLATGIDKLKSVTDELANQVGSIKDTMKANDDQVRAKLKDLDMRVMLLEFKANRSEVIHGLQSRANATLAWATLRYAQVSSAFCDSRRNEAMAAFDYKAARQNVEFCLEKRAHVQLAQAMAHVANSYAGILGSLNVDSDCTAQINGKVASSLTNAELLDDATLAKLNLACKTGGQVVARALMLNIVRYLQQIGPDHRTYDSMGAVSNAVNIAFFGKPWAEVSAADQKAFDDIDPTGARYKNTPYGRVERLFIYNYYAYAFRDANGDFIKDPRKVNVNVPGSVYTERQLLTAAQVGKNLPDYVARVRDLEVQNYCQECGFKITGRSNPASNKSSLVITHNLPGEDKKVRFYFPNDARPNLCPVNDDVVIRHSNGKHYIYHLTFDSWGNDVLTPYLSGGNHMVIANTDNDLKAGNFNSCGYASDLRVERAGMDTASIPTRLVILATRPYGQAYGRPHCTKLTATCALKNNEWQAPQGLLTVGDLSDPASQGKLTRFLTGFPTDVIGALCSRQQAAYGETDVPRYFNGRNITLSHANRGFTAAWSNPSDNNASERAQGYIAMNSTQLIGSAYWPFQDGPLPYTGESMAFGAEKGFVMPLSAGVSSTTLSIRDLDPIEGINAQECTHCPASLRLLGGCGKDPDEVQSR